MLQEESQLNEYDGILISQYSESHSYQLTGALKKMGRKVLGLLSEEDGIESLEKETLKRGFQVLSEGSLKEQSKQHYFSHFVFFFNSSLGLNRELSSREWKLFQKQVNAIRSCDSETKCIVVCPGGIQTEKLAELKKLLEGLSYVLLLSPALFGFKDGGLFQFLLEQYNEVDFELPESENQVKMLWSADLVSFVVSLLVVFPTSSQIFYVEGDVFSLRDFVECFQKYFREHLDARLSLKTILKNLLKRKKEFLFSINSTLAQEGRSYLESYPEIRTSVEKSIEKSFQHFSAHPELESHFLPGRSL